MGQLRLSDPVIITPRLLPGVRVGDAFVSVQRHATGGRTYTFRVSLDTPEFEYEFDFSSPRADIGRGLGDALVFLGSPGHDTFPSEVVRWGTRHSDELSMLAEEIESNPGAVQEMAAARPNMQHAFEVVADGHRVYVGDDEETALREFAKCARKQMHVKVLRDGHPFVAEAATPNADEPEPKPEKLATPNRPKYEVVIAGGTRAYSGPSEEDAMREYARQKRGGQEPEVLHEGKLIAAKEPPPKQKADRPKRELTAGEQHDAAIVAWQSADPRGIFVTYETRGELYERTGEPINGGEYDSYTPTSPADAIQYVLKTSKKRLIVPARFRSDIKYTTAPEQDPNTGTADVLTFSLENFTLQEQREIYDALKASQR